MMLLLGTKFWSWAVLHPTLDVQNENWNYENMTSIKTTSTQTTFICVDIITVFCSFKPCFGHTLSINIDFKFTVKLKAFTNMLRVNESINEFRRFFLSVPVI